MTPKNRVLQFISSLGITASAFERNCGLGNGFVSKIGATIREPKLELISKAYPQLNINWLSHGIGTMLLGDTKDQTNLSSNLPLIHIDSVGGIHSDNAMVAPEYVERYVPFMDSKADDFCIYQSGESMSPTIPSGAILHLREVVNWQEYFGYGGYFVLLLADGRRITKQVVRGETDPNKFVLCKSINPDHSDEELPRSFIRRVFKIINVLTNNGW